MPANPAIVPDHNGLGVLDILAPALDFDLVRCVHDRDVGAEHDRVADGDQAAVEDREVEVRKEAFCGTVFVSIGTCCRPLATLFLPIPQTNVAPVVHAEGRLDDDVLAHVSQQLFQFDHALCREGFERRVGVVREGVVEVVAPAAGLEAHAGELGDEGVVAGGSWWVSWSRWESVCSNALD
jgi:hypothetical protein